MHLPFHFTSDFNTDFFIFNLGVFHAVEYVLHKFPWYIDEGIRIKQVDGAQSLAGDASLVCNSPYDG